MGVSFSCAFASQLGETLRGSGAWARPLALHTLPCGARILCGQGFALTSTSAEGSWQQLAVAVGLNEGKSTGHSGAEPSEQPQTSVLSTVHSGQGHREGRVASEGVGSAFLVGPQALGWLSSPS